MEEEISTFDEIRHYKGMGAKLLICVTAFLATIFTLSSQSILSQPVGPFMGTEGGGNVLPGGARLEW